MRKRLLTVMCLLGLAIVPVHADILQFTFTSDHCSGGCLPAGATNMGTITVTDVSSGVVGVHVELATGFGFVDTGAGAGASFFFRLLPTVGGPTITYSGITAGWSIPNVIGTDQQAAGSYAGDGLMGEFEYALACNPPGATLGCGNGGSAPKSPPLDFTVSATGISAASFNDPGLSGSPFAADVISATGNTGLIDASLSGIPEPTSVVLLGTVLLFAATTLRKKRKTGA